MFVQMHLLKAPEIRPNPSARLVGKTSRISQEYGINNLLYTYLVTPGVAPTLHARARFKLLIKLLFPTLGKPTETGVCKIISLWTKLHHAQKEPGILLVVVLTYNTHSDGRLYVQVAAVVAE